MSSLVLTSSIRTGRAQALEVWREQPAAAEYVPALWVEFVCHSCEELFGSCDCRGAAESPWLKGGWEEHWACFVILKNAQSAWWRVASRLCTAGQSSTGATSRDHGRQVSPSKTCGFSTGVTVSQGSGEEVSAGPALLLHSLQCTHISGIAAVKTEFIIWGDFIPLPCSFWSFRSWLEPSIPAAAAVQERVSGSCGMLWVTVQ